jgi:hypothetical protein
MRYKINEILTIPLPSAVIGIIIGTIHDLWSLRLIYPIYWGVIYLLLIIIVGQRRRRTYINREKNKKKPPNRLRLNLTFEFYLFEFGNAAVTALIFAIITGAIITNFN